MSIVGKRAETSDPRHSFAAATFRKVLKGFEIGGLPYTEVEFQLKRLLATGVSPGELREVLRRSELIQPLPEYAYREVSGLLDEAIEQTAAEQSDPIGAIDQEEQLDPAALSAELLNVRSALESEQARAREAEEALSERIAAEEALRSRLDMTLRESERYQVELRAARNSMASRDKVTAQMRQTLDARDAELAALRAELEALTSSNAQIGVARDSLLAQNKMLAELRQALAERDAQCVALQRQHAETLAALETERHKSLGIERSLTDSNAQIGAARESLASQNKTLGEMRKSLAERDTQLAALRQGHAKAIAESEGRAQKTEEKLQATQRRVAAANSDLEGLRAQVANLQSKLRDSNALIEKLGASVRSEAKRAAQWQAAAQERVPAAGVTLPREEALPPVEVPLRRADAAHASALLTRFRLIVRDRRWNFRAAPRAVWIGAAIVLLATALWFVVHRPPPVPVPSKPAPAAAVVMQPGTTLRDCPTCPVLTVLPAGRFEQGSAPTENGSAFEKPLHWVMIARPVALSTNAVTVDEFREFIAATGRDMQGCDTYDGEWRHHAENNWENPGFAQTGSHPVTCTSWNDAKAYVAWLSAKTGQHYRLPSASEWEYAARAGGTAAQPWGVEGSGACANANVADQSAAHRYPGWAVFACNDGFVQTSPVGSFKANSFGLNDMLGNVFQWTEDCWNADYKGAPIDGAARMDGDCAERELRGGSWFSTPSFVRANYRNHFGVDYRTSSVGIRVARDIAP
jgi:formylglycine-generating enzyme required for sulfatase activity